MNDDLTNASLTGVIHLVDYFSALEGHEIYKNPNISDYSDYFDYKNNGGQRLLELYDYEIPELENKVPPLVRKFFESCIELDRKKIMAISTSIKLITHTLMIKSTGCTKEDYIKEIEQEIHGEYDPKEGFVMLMLIKYRSKLSQEDKLDINSFGSLDYKISLVKEFMSKDEITELNQYFDI